MMIEKVGLGLVAYWGQTGGYNNQSIVQQGQCRVEGRGILNILYYL
jgi:hypothetical protein